MPIERPTATCRPPFTRRSLVTQLACAAAACRLPLPALAAADSPADQSRIEAGGATIEISLNSGQFDLGREPLLAWVTRCAKAVTSYYARFPVAHALVEIVPSSGHRVSHGVSFGEPEAHCRMTVGAEVTQAALDSDWQLTHEMVHFSFPNVGRSHNWIEEGIATYVEPIARASIGWLSPLQVWGDLERGLPQGLPEQGDQGLENTHTWGRTYWGGALFCLVADVQIRKSTGNVKGLQDALRGINRAGGTIEANWPLLRALETGDRATGTGVLIDLYKRMGLKPEPVDLPELWRQLGVARTGTSVSLDSNAPLAAIRQAICG